MNEEFRIICDGGSLRIYKGNYGFNFEEIVDLLNEQQYIIKQLKEEEKLYAQEIIRLNNIIEEMTRFKVLGGDY
jgi:hypothetical protein